jgi:hypothetical protein
MRPSRPFDLRSVGNGLYEVWINNGGPTVPATRTGNKVDWDRKSLNLKIKKGYKPPPPVPGLFTKDEAMHVAHSIGRYCLNLGDMVFAYVTVDGRINDNFFNSPE